jgi:RHS repeat-associated protein
LSYSNAGVADPLNRLQSVSYDTSLVAAPLVVPGSPTVTYSYRTKTATELKDINQVAQIQVAGVSSEVFDYDSHGRLHEKRITLSGRPSPMTITYDYDNTSRLNQITYPEQYPGTSRKVVTHNYDIAGRMDNLKVNNVDYASQIAYNTESQITTFKVGTGTNQVTENYTYDAITGLVLNQTVTRGGTTLQSLGYDYHRGLCEDPNAACDGSDWVYWTTGQITRVSNGVTGKLLHFNYDELGRLTNTDQGRWIQTSPKFGIWEYKTDWKQDYTYDRHGNRTSVTASNNSGVTPTPQDGLGSLGYDQNSNRINSAGFTYDAAGNQLQNGTGQSFIYDAAGRLVKVKDANGNTLETYTYNASRRRLITQHGNESSTSRTFYVWSGDSVIAEYTEPSGAAMPKWARNYIYFGTGLLATQEPNGSGGELVRYHHPDQLGTRLITNNADTSYLTQSHMPFGNSLETNSATNRVFTSYERSGASLVDYALNRNYDSRQGRFTQVDPLGMDAVDLLNPQSLNLYSYVANDPVNSTDPSGTFGFGFSINGPGHSFPGVGPGSNGGGLLGGLANFGLGLLSSIFGGGTGSQRHIIGSPFFSLPPSLPILPLPGPVTSTITESFVWNGEQPTAETPKQGTGTAPKDVLRSHAFSFTGFGYVKWAHRHISYRAVEGVIIGIESDITQAIIGYSDQFVGKHTTATSIPYRGHAQINDDKGHIIGAGLGGGVTPFNLFWQSRSVNRGAYERFEREIRKTLTEHRDWSAHIVVQLFYPKITQIIFGNGFRPKGGAYYVVYWKDGKPVYTGWPFKFSN